MLGPLTRWLLPASLTVNVFLSAALLSHAWRRADFGPPGPPPGGFRGPGDHGPGRMLEQMLATLPPADAAVLRASFAPYLDTLSQTDRARHATPHRVRKALAAPTVDLDQLRAVFADARVAHTRFESTLEAALLDAVPKLTPEGRRALAAWNPGPPPPPPPR